MRDMRTTGWRVAAGAVLVAASPMALSSAADAQCLAILHAKARTVVAGSTVRLVGKNYSSTAPGTIDIRIDTREAPIIASFAPRSAIDDLVTIPSGTAPGIHTLLATQRNALGDQVTCGPGRTSVDVIAAGRAGAEAAAPAAVSGVARGARQVLPGLAPLGLSLLGLVLLRRMRGVPGRREVLRATG